MKCKFQCALLLLVVAAIAVVLVAPSYDLLPTTVRDISPAHLFLPATLASPLYYLALAVSGATIITSAVILSPELLSLTCTRLC